MDSYNFNKCKICGVSTRSSNNHRCKIHNIPCRHSHQADGKCSFCGEFMSKVTSTHPQQGCTGFRGSKDSFHFDHSSDSGYYGGFGHSFGGGGGSNSGYYGGGGGSNFGYYGGGGGNAFSSQDARSQESANVPNTFPLEGIGGGGGNAFSSQNPSFQLESATAPNLLPLEGICGGGGGGGSKTSSSQDFRVGGGNGFRLGGGNGFRLNPLNPPIFGEATIEKFKPNGKFFSRKHFGKMSSIPYITKLKHDHIRRDALALYKSSKHSKDRKIERDFNDDEIDTILTWGEILFSRFYKGRIAFVYEARCIIASKFTGTFITMMTCNRGYYYPRGFLIPPNLRFPYDHPSPTVDPSLLIYTEEESSTIDSSTHVGTEDEAVSYWMKGPTGQHPSTHVYTEDEVLNSMMVEPTGQHPPTPVYTEDEDLNSMMIEPNGQPPSTVDDKSPSK